jgi:hypothetical protein
MEFVDGRPNVTCVRFHKNQPQKKSNNNTTKSILFYLHFWAPRLNGKFLMLIKSHYINLHANKKWEDVGFSIQTR